MYSSQLTHICNKEVSLNAKTARFANRDFHAKMQPQGWIQENNA
jgi:hypothetical protein